MNKIKLSSKFVVALEDILIGDKEKIEKNSVGILESQTGHSAKVHFIVLDQIVEINIDTYRVFDVSKIGDSFSKKICNVCHKLLNTKKFAKNQNAKGDRSVRRPSCTKCRKIIDGVKVKNKTKKEWLLNKPHKVLFTCPVCEKTTVPGVTSKVVLDHNHENGKVRDWICDSCNTGLGRFKDDPKILKRGIEYLEEKDQKRS